MPFNYYNLSSNQLRYYLAEKYTDSSYMVPIYFLVHGDLDLSLLQSSISQISSRHEILKTKIILKDGIPTAQISEKPEYQFHVKEVSDLQEKTILNTVQPNLNNKADFTNLASLQRYFILHIPETKSYAIVFAHHHSISDGISLDTFAYEVFCCYDNKSLEPALSFYDTAIAKKRFESQRNYTQFLDFWKKDLEGVDAVPDLEGDITEGVSNCEGNFITNKLTTDLSSAITSLCKLNNISTFTFLSAIYALQLKALTDLSDIVFSFQSSGRFGIPRDKAILGPFSNAVMLRLKIDRDLNFIDFLKYVQKKVKLSLQHEALPYHELIKTTGIEPHFSLNFYPDEKPIKIESFKLSERKFLNSLSDYSLNFRWSHTKKGLRGTLFFNKEKLSGERIHSFWKRHIEIIESVIQNPENKCLAYLENNYQDDSFISDIKLPTEGFHVNFFKKAESSPHKKALSHKNRSFSYSQLKNYVLTAAQNWIDTGIQEGQTIAILSERHPDLIISILAASYLGVSFCILDQGYPPDRLLNYISLLNPDWIVCNSKGSIPEWCTDSNLSLNRIIKLHYSNNPYSNIPIEGKYNPQKPAYYLFTSGTTGNPKCIGVPVGPLNYFINWQSKQFQLDASDQFSLLGGLAHDPVFRDIFTPLSIGACLHIPDQSTMYSPMDLLNWLITKKISICHLTPPLGQLLTSVPGKTRISRTNLKIMFWGGDHLPLKLIQSIQSIKPSIRHINFYGATETPQAMSFFEISAAYPWNHIPIGKGIDGIKLTVKQSDRCCSVNEVGDIVVQTPYRVFKKEHEHLKEISSPQLVYNTGDKGFFLPDGKVVVIGRSDDQVKIRSFRVNLQEINQHLLSVKGIKHAVSITKKNGDQNQLVTFIETCNQKEIETSKVKAELKKKLPDYMIPNIIIALSEIPRLPNGKINRQALYSIETSDNKESSSNDFFNSTTTNEKQICRIFETSMQVKVNSTQSSFSDLGGDSLSSLQVLYHLQKIIPKIPDDWIYMSIEELGKLVITDERTNVFQNIIQMIPVAPHVILRAIGIFLVVALHYQWFSLHTSITFILFLFAGYSFGQFQLIDTLEKNSVLPIRKYIIKILTITIPFLIVYYIGSQPRHLSTLLLYANWLNYNFEFNDGRIISLWFIGCYIQMFIMLYIILAFSKIRSLFKKHKFKTIALFFFIAFLLRFLIPLFFDYNMLINGIQTLTIWTYLPTTHIATIFLGMLLASADDNKKKIFCLGVALIYSLIVQYFTPVNNAIVFTVCAFLMLFIKHIPIPNFMVKPIILVSSSSLYIYLAHPMAHKIFSIIGIPHFPWLYTILGIIFCIISWHLWEFTTIKIKNIFGYLRNVTLNN